jgi:hypothetical protein
VVVDLLAELLDLAGDIRLGLGHQPLGSATIPAARRAAERAL